MKLEPRRPRRGGKAVSGVARAPVQCERSGIFFVLPGRSSWLTMGAFLPMPSFLRSRQLWIALTVLALAACAVRFWLGGYAVRSVLGLAGASDIRFAQVRATPWRIVVEGLHFTVRTQEFDARRVT